MTSRFNLVAALATLAVCLGLVAAGDRTGWSQGYGFDGRTYGDLAEHFPGAVFGDEGVTPPGYGPYTEERPQGIDAYYVRRILPSAVVYFSLSALSIEHTPNNVIACFGVWNALMVALVALLWCLIADRLGIRREGKLLGLLALLANFAILKAAFYWPVVTDIFAFGFGAAALYFWISRNTWALAAVTFLGAFAWPTLLLIGALLMIFPPGDTPLGRREAAEGAAPKATLARGAAAAIPALALLAYLVHLRSSGYEADAGIPLGGVFPLAAAASAIFVFLGLLWLVPDLGRRELRAIGDALLSHRTLVAVGVVAGVLVAQALIAERASTVDQGEVFDSGLWYSALNPGLFVVVAICYFGPALAVTGVNWPGICRRVLSLGPGAALVMALFVVSCLGTEPRKLIVFYPFVVLFFVLETGRLSLRRWFLPVFFGVSLIVSRVWLPIGKFDGSALTDFPAQRYFMSSGIWTSSEMYFAQLGVALLLVGLAVGFMRGGADRIARPQES